MDRYTLLFYIIFFWTLGGWLFGVPWVWAAYSLITRWRDMRPKKGSVVPEGTAATGKPVKKTPSSQPTTGVDVEKGNETEDSTKEKAIDAWNRKMFTGYIVLTLLVITGLGIGFACAVFINGNTSQRAGSLFIGFASIAFATIIYALFIMYGCCCCCCRSTPEDTASSASGSASGSPAEMSIEKLYDGMDNMASLDKSFSTNKVAIALLPAILSIASIMGYFILLLPSTSSILDFYVGESLTRTSLLVDLHDMMEWEMLMAAIFFALSALLTGFQNEPGFGLNHWLFGAGAVFWIMVGESAYFIWEFCYPTADDGLPHKDLEGAHAITLCITIVIASMMLFFAQGYYTIVPYSLQVSRSMQKGTLKLKPK